MAEAERENASRNLLPPRIHSEVANAITAGPTRPIQPSPSHAPARRRSSWASKPNVITKYSAVSMPRAANGRRYQNCGARLAIYK